MTTHDSAGPAEAGDDPEPTTITLEPLRTDGPDALATQDVPGLLRATLREIEIRWENALHEVMVWKAADLFACSAERFCEPIPHGGNLARAVLDLHFEHAERPRRLEIRPPHQVLLESAADGRLILPWLERRRFRRARRLAQCIAVLLVASACALSPPADDDDCDWDRYSLVE